MHDEFLSSNQLMRLNGLFALIFKDWTDISVACLATMTGWETTVFKVEAKYTLDGYECHTPLILRVYQGKGQELKARKEYGIMKRLHELDYSVPKVYHLERDPSFLGNHFLVMEFIDGVGLSQAHDTGDEETKRRLATLFIQTLADLHSIDPGYFVSGQGSDGIHGITVPTAGCGSANPMTLDFLKYLKGEALLNGIESLYDAFGMLEEKLSDIEPAPLCLIHCDYHGSNVILKPDGTAVVIDWGQGRTGDYRYDLAWTLLLSNAGEGTAMREALLKLYSEASGRNVADIRYFDALASAMRLALTVIALKGSPEELGLRAGAAEEMKSSGRHMAGVYSQFYDILGIRIPELEEFFPELKCVVS